MKKHINLIVLLIIIFIGTKAQVPYNLNSNPSAAPTVLLDFDGQTVSDEFWTPFNYDGGDSIIYAQPANLTTAQIIKIFNHIAEDFSPFNINITTDSTVYFAAPITKRTRLIITPTSAWYGGSAGGVAYLESFRWGYDIPCWAFIVNNDKRTAEVGSHEIGHTLGLYHQSQYAYAETDTCKFVSEYLLGPGFNDIGWSPIMGNSYSKNLTTWHTGRPSYGCKFIQNDISIILNPLNGITYKTDDHGNTVVNGTNVTITNGNFNITGLINDSNDVDYFNFQFSVPGRFTANIKPFNNGKEIVAAFPLSGITNYNANVDLEVTLFRNGVFVASYNPVNLLDAKIDTILDPGTYSLKVNSVTNVNARIKAGLIGTYTLLGSFTNSVIVPIRDIDIDGKVYKSLHKINWKIQTDESVENAWIEVSTNGIDFRKIQIINGIYGSFEYNPKENESYYRIGATTISQPIVYSKTIYIKPIVNSNYKIVSNTIYNNQLIINTKKIYEWRLIDISGKKISNGRFTNGQNIIEIPNNNGIYLIQIIGDATPHLEKIIKL